ncbi:hypothetical protein DL98DRAFT_314479 [Cadophora sp. DSE1049]|nr:hypothetical protein DL98DRAFT_314479 [Cadophora sp. DSE1049]
MSTVSISTEEQRKALELYNEARREAPGPSRPDLVWSNTLTAAAEEWGKKMVRKLWDPASTKHDPRLQLKPHTMGENLFAGEGGRITLSTAVRGWVRDKEVYDGGPVTGNGLGKNGKKVGHYTQIGNNPINSNTSCIKCEKKLICHPRSFGLKLRNWE